MNITEIRRQLLVVADELRPLTYLDTDLSVAWPVVDDAYNRMQSTVGPLNQISANARVFVREAQHAITHALSLLAYGHNRSTEVPNTIRAYVQVARHEVLEALWCLDEVDGGLAFHDPLSAP